MKTTEFYVGILASGLLLVSCEDLIDVDLNAAAPRVVIEANLDDLYTHQPKPPEGGQNPPTGGLLPPENGHEDGGGHGPRHFVYVSKSVAFNDPRYREVVADATVEVEEVGTGRKFPFVYEAKENPEEGIGMSPFLLPPYVSETFAPVAGRSYTLRVWVDGQLYESTETMPFYIEVDSVTAERDESFDDHRYYGTFAFRDPPGEANYYRYSHFSGSAGDLSLGSPWVFSDKFNDGREAVHRYRINAWPSNPPDEDGNVRVTTRVKRQVISPAMYQYWREVRAINPAATAPANPKSNISNGALGFFSVSSARVYDVDLTEVYRPWSP